MLALGMATDIINWLKSCALCHRNKPGDGSERYALVQDIAGAHKDRFGVDLSGSKTALSVAKCLQNYGKVRASREAAFGLGSGFHVSKHLFELWSVH